MAVNLADKANLRTLRIRQKVSSLAAADLAALRQAFTAMYGFADDRGYGHHAGIHGLPLPMFCHHGDLLFLPWHRAYLYFFEQALMDQVDAARLAWWDWTDHSVGIPAALADANVAGAPNPLSAAPITGIPTDQLARVGLRLPNGTIAGITGPVTFRRPKRPQALPSAANVESVLQAPNFADFSNRMETLLHNAVHVWAGGVMSQIPLAGFDPLFWTHHTMVDRLWYLWQLRHPDTLPDTSLIDQALAPFPMTVRQTLDVNGLGYDYAVTTNTSAPVQ